MAWGPKGTISIYLYHNPSVVRVDQSQAQGDLWQLGLWWCLQNPHQWRNCGVQAKWERASPSLPQHIQRRKQLWVLDGEYCQRQFWRSHQAWHCQGKGGSKAPGDGEKPDGQRIQGNIAWKTYHQLPHHCARTLRMPTVSLVLISLTLGGNG